LLLLPQEYELPPQDEGIGLGQGELSHNELNRPEKTALPVDQMLPKTENH